MMNRDWFSRQSASAHTLLSDPSGSMPDEEFGAKTLRMAELLSQSFPDRHSHVGLWGENSLDYLIALFAVLRAGHVAVPLNSRFSPRELADISEAANLSGILVPRDFPKGHREALGNMPLLALAPKLAANSDAKPRKLRELAEKDVAVLICSSGSSGRPKIIPLTLKSLLDHAAAVCQHLSVTWHDRWIVCLPLYHVGGLTVPFRCLISGASMIFSRSNDPDELNRLIAAEGATLISVVPTVLERMLNKRGAEPYPRTLRAIIVGGGPVPTPLLARCPQAYATYGLTEAGSMVTCARPGCGDAERKSAGPALPKTEVKIVNAAGKEAKPGEVGQILVRGPGLAATASGWIPTGDVGRIDEKGFLYPEARRSDLVVSGGENVYPAEIEAALRQHPRVQAAVVLPVEDAEWGQTPAALIVLSPGRPLEKLHIYQFLEDKLARFKFPRRVIFAPELPLLPTGKPDLVTIRKMLGAAPADSRKR